MKLYLIQSIVLVDCIWSQWTPCSATCAGAKRKRYALRHAKYGGKECSQGDDSFHVNQNIIAVERDFCNFEPCTGIKMRLEHYLNPVSLEIRINYIIRNTNY